MYYAVIVGKTPGIYETKEEALREIEGVPHGCCRKFRTREEAAQFFVSREAQMLRDSLAGRRYYAVARGTVPGIYTDRTEAMEMVTGFSGARLRAFPTYEQARQFLLSEGIEDEKSRVEIREGGAAPEAPKNPETEKITGIIEGRGVFHAWTDGSFAPGKKTCGYGVVLEGDGTCFEISGTVQEGRKDSLGAEIAAALRAVKEAKLHGAVVLVLHYDCAALAENEELRAFCREQAPDLTVILVKVRAHGTDKNNARADALAVAAIKRENVWQ